jgi:hypothetical protein
VNHPVEGVEVFQPLLDPVHAADHLAAQPPARLRERTGLVAHHDQQLLALFGEVPHRLGRAAHVVLDATEQAAGMLQLGANLRERDDDRERDGDERERDERERYCHGRPHPRGRGGGDLKVSKHRHDRSSSSSGVGRAAQGRSAVT